MITRDEMFPPVFQASPSFSKQWNEFIGEWRGDPNGLPHCLVLADLARHLISLLKAGKNEEMQAVLTVVEHWLLDGNHYAREAATVGLLDGFSRVS